MPPVQAEVDYYALLEISNTATLEVATKSYRRLARLNHPDKNLDNHGSTAVFQNLQNAYETIKDAEKRQAYDIAWPSIRDRLQAQHEAETHRAEAKEREQRRANQERAKQERAEEGRQKRIRPLDPLRRRYNDDIFELARAVRKLTADLARLQDKDDEYSRKDTEQKSWWTYLALPFYGKPKETRDQKMDRETERIQRLAIRRIKESELKEKETKLNRLHDGLRDVNDKIAAENNKAKEASQTQEREERLRKEQEERMKAEREMWEKWEKSEEIRVKAQKERAEREAKKAREAEATRKAQEEQERIRKAAAAARDKLATEQVRKRQELAEKYQKLEEERIQATHAAEEAARKSRVAQEERVKPTTSMYGFSHAPNLTHNNCRHEKFWPKVEGRQQCNNCSVIQNRFAFQCPGCGMIACANCRQNLRGEVRKGYKPRGQKDLKGFDVTSLLSGL